MNYAVIKDGIVKNIIVADYYNASAIAQSQGAIAVDVSEIAAATGDTYTEDFHFFRNGRDINDPLPVDEGSGDSIMDILDSLILDNLIMTEVVDTLVLAQLEG